MAWKGKFRPKNPEKYRGDSSGIVFRSSLELKVMKKLDDSANVLWWSSEELHVNYVDPTKRGPNGRLGRPRRYFPDMVYCRKNADGTQTTVMVEIKMEKESKPPTHGPRKRRSTIISEELTWATNSAKWEAARAFCAKQGWVFEVMTEREIGRTY